MRPYSPAGAAAKFAFLLVAIVVVQGILAYRFRFVAYFDLPLIYCVYYGFTRARPVGAVFVGTVLGLMQDSLSGIPLGTNGFSKTLVSFLAASAGLKFDVDQSITRLIALILFTFLDSVVKLMVGGLSAAGWAWSGPGGLVLSAVCNVAVGFVLFGYRSRTFDATA